MSQIDQLISQAGIQGTFDVRCLYRGGFTLPHEQSPAGVMPFHLLMKGEIRVSTAQGDDVVLRPGDLLLLPGGEPHTIWREGDALALAEPGDGLLPRRGDGGDQVEFLCGEYRYQGPLRPLLLDALPSPLCIPLLASESQQALSLVLSLIHQELLREQQGSGQC
ncbi:AraC family transcriptional regulator [Aeromonas hydrophila]|nr:AraC family transcriptional regulator [Aeromonas hydrophila]